jgi:hypothetical protein
MPRIRTVPVILAIVFAATAGASRAARSEECLAGPNAASPQGKHWYYRIDRATHRKCWYLGALDGRRQRASVARAVRSARVASPAEPAPPAVSPEPPPQTSVRAAAPDAAFGTRWPPEAPAAGAPAPRAEVVRPAATAAPLPDRIAVRTVAITAERVTSEPAAPKPQQSAPAPSAATPAATPAPEERGALPAALFGIALLLAVVGTILVRARRRLIARLSAARSPHDVGRPDEAERGPPLRSRLSGTWPRGPGHAMRAMESSDIAAATLQPAIDPLPARAIEPAPDVEQSLRLLLDAWERRAA